MSESTGRYSVVFVPSFIGRKQLQQNDDRIDWLFTKNKILAKGTIVDATISKRQARQNEKKSATRMKSVKKGNNWYFGCKAISAWIRKAGLYIPW